ncbi:MAG: hypothetical protein O6947_00975, partial [Acidobacteria bacterium]|nr:hypothetical protein [Acidobacteriota bacterium]
FLPGLGAGGAAAGLLLFSWLGLPLLGGRTSLLVLLALVLAVAGFLQPSGSGWKREWKARLWIVLPVLMFLGGLLSPGWSPGVLTSGIYRYPAMISARFSSGGDFLEFRRAASPIYFHHGASGTIAVERGTDPGREGLFLTVDGTVEENWSTRILGYALTGHIAMLLRPGMPIEPRVALLGMGAGVTARSILLHDPASLTVIEPEAKVLEALQEFTDLSGPLLESPRIEIVHADPRNFWILSSAEFDVVVSRGPEPWLVRGGPMYTREFFRQCRKHLTPAGIQVHRFPLAGLTEENLKGILQGFLQAYPETVAFEMTDRDILLIGSSAPLKFSLASIQDRIRAPKVMADLSIIGVPGQNSILGRFLAGHEDLDLFTAGAAPFTDRMLPTQDLPRNLPTRETRDLMSRMDGVGKRILPFLAGFEEREKQGQTMYGLAKTLILRGANILAEDITEEIERLGFGERAGWLHGQLALQKGDKDRAFDLWESVLESDPDHLDSLMSLGGYFQDFGLYNAAEPYLARLEQAYPKKSLAQFYHGKNLYYLLKDGASEIALKKVLEMEGTALYPSSLYFLGMLAKRNARTEEGIEYLSLYLKRAYGSGQLSLLEASTHQTLAELYRRLDQPDRAEQEEEMARRLTESILQVAGDGTDE